MSIPIIHRVDVFFCFKEKDWRILQRLISVCHVFLFSGIMNSNLPAAQWIGADEIGSPRSWTIGDNWLGSAVPGPTDINTFGVVGDGVINLDDSQSTGGLEFQDFTTTTLKDNGPGYKLTMTSPGTSLLPIISTGEGVRHTYGCDYFTAGREIAADLILDDDLKINMGNNNDSALMLSGQITANSPTYNITLENTASSSGWFQGNSLWITANNTNFHGTVDVNSGTNNVRWGTAIKFADDGRLDSAPIVLHGNLSGVSLLARADSAYDNTITSVSGGVSLGFECPVIHADRSYQNSDMANETGQVMVIGNVVLDNPSTVFGDVSAIAFGSNSQYMRTNNNYIIAGKQLILGTAAPANSKIVLVHNGNFTAGRAGNRYVGGTNNMNVSINEARFYDSASNTGLVDNGQPLIKDGLGILEIDGNNTTTSTGPKDIQEGVLRFTTLQSIGPLGTPITINPDAGLGIGWNNTLPTGISLVGTLFGSSGALDVDAANFTSTLNFNTNLNIQMLRLGSSSRSGGTVSGLISPQPTPGGLWHLLGGGGGTLTIHSNLDDMGQGAATGLEMATTGFLLPGRVILDPDSHRNFNGFTGPTMIYAGTLQPTSRRALEFTPYVSVNTTCTDFDGSFIRTKSTGQVMAGTQFSFEGPGQLLLNPSVEYAFAQGFIRLEGGAVGWTGDKEINSIAGDVGTYFMPLNSFLWWDESLGGSESARPTNLLHLGGEYSQGIMKMGISCSITNQGSSDVALVKSGIYSTLDLSTGPGAGNTYTGGTAIIGGELIVSDSIQVCGNPNNPVGGPILIANGGVLHVTDTTTFANCLRLVTNGTPDTNIGMSRMTTLCNGSVVEVDADETATFTGLLDGRPAFGSSRMYTTITPFEKTGGGTMCLDYQSPLGTHKQYPYANTDTNHWGIKLTEGWVTTNQLPYVVTTPNGQPDRSNGYIVCNGGNLEIRTPPTNFNFHDDAAFGGSFWTYGFFGFNSFKDTESIISVQDDALFRVSAVSPIIIMGTVILDAQDNDNNPTNNLFHLRMAADPNHNPEEDLSPGGDSRGTGILDLRGGMVILTTREGKQVLPTEADFTLKLNGGIFNGMTKSDLNGNLIINEQSASGTPQIDGQEANKDWQVPLVPSTWTIKGTGTTSWRGILGKIGPGTVAFNRELGAPVIVDSATDTLKISAGIVNAGGSGDPFTDSANPGLHINVLNNAAFNITQGTKDVATISGTGATSVSVGATLLVGSEGPVTQTKFVVDGAADVGDVVVSNITVVGDGINLATLSATSITTDTLQINASAKVTIKPLPGGPLGCAITPVPEPSALIMTCLGIAGLLAYARKRRM
jgi:hypothetical protein